MLILLYALIALTIIIFYLYYQNQNSKEVIGGRISLPKIMWLGYAVFNYFIFSVWHYFQTPATHIFQPVIVVILELFFIRFVAQMFLMFVLKRWQPPMGMAYNILCAIVLCGFILQIIQNKSAQISFTEGGILLYFLSIVLILITDTYYAFSFYKIVGKKTMGAQAIWYASDEDPRFQRINRLTARLNGFFYTLTTLIVLHYHLSYGS